MFSGSAIAKSAPLLVAAGLAAVLAAGCSSSASPAASGGQAPAGSASPAQAIQLAAAHARLASSVTATVSVQGSGSEPMTLSGAMSEEIRPDFQAEADFTTAVVDGQTLTGGMTEIITSQAFYARMSLLSELTGGKPWLEVPYSALGKALGVNMQQVMQQAQNQSPLTQTQLMAGATGVRTVGTGTVNGIAVTEYSGSYTVAAALKRLPASLRSQVATQLTKAGITSASFSVWLDGQQQARKLIVTEHGTQESMTMTMVVTSINQPVSIHLPPASQVAALPAIALNA